MSGHQLLQAVDPHPEYGAGLLDREDRAQEFFGRHLLAILRREQAALRSFQTALGLQNDAELRSGLASDALQFVFGGPPYRRLMLDGSMLLG